MKITVLGENFYQIEEFQKYFRVWVKESTDQKIMISFDCCPISLFLLSYHIKYDDKINVKYLLSVYMPKYYQTNQIIKFFKENAKKIKNSNIIIFSTFTYITDIEPILEEYKSIEREQFNPDYEGRDIRDIKHDLNLDKMDIALLENCKSIMNFIKNYKTVERTPWEVFNEYQKQSSIIMGKFTKQFNMYHLLIYTNFINAYLGDINDNKFKSLLSYWYDKFSMDIIYLVGKEGDYIDIRTNEEHPVKYKEKYMVYDNIFLPFIEKPNIKYIIFKKLMSAFII
jgi:hypothetical protein